MVYAVIMAGGSGTRFWPHSRVQKPKQLLTIVGNKTMIRATVERILPVIPFERILVVAGVTTADAIRLQLPELNTNMVVAEPEARNTAPCVALAAYKLFKTDPESVMAVMPSDHLIRNEPVFLNGIEFASDLAAFSNNLLTFGIVPDRPETGYGYLELGNPVCENNGFKAYGVKRFVEKPDATTATSYISSGNYMWNSGMFVWRSEAIINAFREHLPKIAETIESIFDRLNTDQEISALNSIYSDLESVSIDYGIMEKSEKVLVVPLECAWNDVGCWSSLDDVWDSSEGNAVDGMALCLDSHGCIISSPHKLTTLVGVKDLIVVDTQDALLVCRKKNAQDVKKLQQLLREKGYQNLL